MMSCTIDEALNKAREYQKTYMPPGSAFKMGEDAEGTYDLINHWESDRSWPYATEPGVYLIADEKHVVLYIGKASNKSSIGKRLATYFRTNEDMFETVHTWKKRPRYVHAIAVVMPHEAPSLEEFLITECDPIENTVGRKSDED